MKNNEMIQQFHNKEFGDLDILMIDDRPYFPATECAVILGYRNPHDAISKHCRYLAKHARSSTISAGCRKRSI